MGVAHTLLYGASVPADIELDPIGRYLLNSWIESSILQSAGADNPIVRCIRGTEPSINLQHNARARIPCRLLKRMLKRERAVDVFRMELAVNAARRRTIGHGAQERCPVTIDRRTLKMALERYSMGHCNIVITRDSSKAAKCTARVGAPGDKGVTTDDIGIQRGSGKLWFVISYAKDDTANKDVHVGTEGPRVRMQENVYSSIKALYMYAKHEGLPIWWDGLTDTMGERVQRVWPAVVNLHYVSQPVLIVPPGIKTLDRNSVSKFRRLFVRTWPGLERQCSTAADNMYIVDIDIARICAVLLASINELVDDLGCDEMPVAAHLLALAYRATMKDRAIDVLMTLIEQQSRVINGNLSRSEPLLETCSRMSAARHSPDLYSAVRAAGNSVLATNVVMDTDEIIGKYRCVFERVDKAKVAIAELKEMVEVLMHAHIIKTGDGKILDSYKDTLDVFGDTLAEKNMVQVAFGSHGMYIAKDGKPINNTEWDTISLKKTNLRNVPFSMLFTINAGSDVHCQGDKFVTAAVYENLAICLQRLLDAGNHRLHPFRFLMDSDISTSTWRNIDRQSAHEVPVVWRIRRQQVNWPKHIQDTYNKEYCWPGFAATPNGDTILKQAHAVMGMSSDEFDMHYKALQRDAIDHIVAVAYSTNDSVATAAKMWIIYTGLFRFPLDHWRACLGGNNDLLAVQVPVNLTGNAKQHRVEDFLMFNFVSPFFEDNMEIAEIDGVKGFLTKASMVDLSNSTHNSEIGLRPLFIVTDYSTVESARDKMNTWLDGPESSSMWIG